MLKKRIAFKDLDGNDLVEDFYFNLTQAEIAEMEISHMQVKDGKESGGFAEMLKGIVASGDGRAIMDAFKDILRMSYGVRSDDGRRFMKSPTYFEEFMETDAYSVLFMQLVTDADAAAAFIRGLTPADLSEKVADRPSPERVEELKAKLAEAPAVVLPPAMAAINSATEPRQKDLEEMSVDELRALLKRKAEKDV